MRRLVWLLVGLAALWCLYWGSASFMVNRSVSGWFDARRAEGWQAEVTDVTSTGFPNQLVTQVNGAQLADPETGLAIQLDELTLSARAIWPGDVTVSLPSTPVLVVTPQDRWRLLATGAQADLNLHPGAALELENMSATSGPFRLETADGLGLLGGEDLTLALRQSEAPSTYELTFDISAFSPGEGPRAALLLPDDWPRLFKTLRADVTISFDRPLDRRTLEDRRPQPLAIDLARAEAEWGDIRFLATGTVVADENGYAEGSVTLKAENWLQMLEMAQAAGVLPPEFRPQTENILRSLAAGTGKTNDIDVTLRLDGGLIRLGFIPIGPAPSMRIR